MSKNIVENLTEVKVTNHRTMIRNRAGKGSPPFDSMPIQCLGQAADRRPNELVAEPTSGQRELLKEIESSMGRIVDARLIAFGLEESDRKELVADLRHLRAVRKRAEQVHSFILRAVITGVLTGVLGAVWLGLRSAIGR